LVRDPGGAAMKNTKKSVINAWKDAGKKTSGTTKEKKK